MEQSRIKQLLVHIMQFFKQHKLSSIIIAAGIILASGAIVALTILTNNQKPVASKLPPARVQPIPPAPAPKFYSPLTGLEVADQAATQKQVREVQIENSPDARPQSGLKQAGVVFEADADGGITRFAVLYQESHPALIGPVRSLRPYFLDWITPFDASISHVGGSAKALDVVRNGSYKDLDEFFNSAYYWRSTDRYAPHNVYTSSDKLDQLNQAKGYTSSSFTGFPRKDEKPAAAPTATSINFTISYDPYNVHYDYDKPSNSYIRYQSGVKHVDREEGQIQPKVVIAIKVPTSVALEDGYRVEMQTAGSGTTYIFQDGLMTQGTWSKSGAKSQMTFTDSNGKTVALDRGQTWITAVAPENNVSWQ